MDDTILLKILHVDTVIDCYKRYNIACIVNDGNKITVIDDKEVEND